MNCKWWHHLNLCSHVRIKGAYTDDNLPTVEHLRQHILYMPILNA